jgi:hypothetical protein
MPISRPEASFGTKDFTVVSGIAARKNANLGTLSGMF